MRTDLGIPNAPNTWGSSAIDNPLPIRPNEDIVVSVIKFANAPAAISLGDGLQQYLNKSRISANEWLSMVIHDSATCKIPRNSL